VILQFEQFTYAQTGFEHQLANRIIAYPFAGQGKKQGITTKAVEEQLSLFICNCFY